MPCRGLVSTIGSFCLFVLHVLFFYIPGELVNDAAAQGETLSCDNGNLSDDNNSATSDDLWAIHDTLVLESNKVLNRDNAGGIPIELRQYLNTSLAPRNSDPLALWSDLRAQYPNVYKIAVKYLANSATSVPSERLFSKAGQVMTKQRNRLCGKNLDMILFLQSVKEEIWFI